MLKRKTILFISILSLTITLKQTTSATIKTHVFKTSHHPLIQNEKNTTKYNKISKRKENEYNIKFPDENKYYNYNYKNIIYKNKENNIRNNEKNLEQKIEIGEISSYSSFKDDFLSSFFKDQLQQVSKIKTKKEIKIESLEKELNFKEKELIKEKDNFLIMKQNFLKEKETLIKDLLIQKRNIFKEREELLKRKEQLDIQEMVIKENEKKIREIQNEQEKIYNILKDGNFNYQNY